MPLAPQAPLETKPRRTYTEAQRVTRRRATKKWRLANWSRVQEYNKKHSREYNRSHKEQVKAQKHLYYLAHKKEHWMANIIWVAKNRPRVNRASQEYQARLRLKVLKHYSPDLTCLHCGTDDIRILTLDHINGGGGKIRKELGTVREFITIVRNNFPPGFQILCFNCHILKDRKYNPYLLQLVKMVK